MESINNWWYVETIRRCKNFLLTEYTISCFVEELVTVMFSRGHIDYHLNQRITETLITWDKLDLLINALIDPTRDLDTNKVFEDLVAHFSKDPCFLFISEKLTETLQEVQKLTPEKPKEVNEKIKQIQELNEGIMRISIFEIQQSLAEMLTDYESWKKERSKKQNEEVADVAKCDDTEVSDDTNTPLMTAAIEDNYLQLEKILSQTPAVDINAVNGKEETALSIACRKASAQFVKKLLTIENINVNSQDKLGATAFMYSMARCDIEVIDALLQCDRLDLEVTDNNNLNYIWYLLPGDILNDLVSTVQVPNNQIELEECLANFILTTKHKQAAINWEKQVNLVTFLLTSEKTNNIDMLKTLVLLGNETLVALVLNSLNTEITKNSLEDVILNTITSMNPEVVKIICDSPKIPFQYINSYCAMRLLNHASHHDVSNIKRLMLCVTSGPHITKALKIAMSLNSMDVYTVSVLLDGILTILDTTDEEGNDVFMILCEYGSIELLEQLLKHPQINLTTKNRWGQTAYMISFENPSKDVPNLILKHCLTTMDVNGKDWHGITNLMYVSKFGNYDAVKTLLSHPDIDTGMTDWKGFNALFHACCSGVYVMGVTLNGRPRMDAKMTHNINYTRITQLLLQCKMIDKHATDKHGNNSLMLAIAAGNVDMVSTLLDAGVTDINATNDRGLTACHMACLGGTESIVTKLFKAGMVNMNATGEYTMFGSACAGGNEAIVAKVLKMGVNVNEPNNKGVTGLMLACESGAEKVVDMLLAMRNIDVNVKDIDGRSALFRASKSLKHKIVSKLIQHTPDIDVTETDSDGENLFMAACWGGSNFLVTMCLDKGVNVNETCNDGQTGLIKACEWGRETVVDTLLRVSNIDIDIKDNRGHSALYYAAHRWWDLKILSKLMEHTPEIFASSADSECGHFFILTCEIGDNLSVKMFLSMGVNVNRADDDMFGGDTGLIMACREGHDDVVKTLLGASMIDVNLQNQSGETALIVACQFPSERIVKMLLDVSNIDVHVKDKTGRNALAWACQMRHDRVSAMLKGAGAVDESESSMPRRAGGESESYMPRRAESEPSMLRGAGGESEASTPKGAGTKHVKRRKKKRKR